MHDSETSNSMSITLFDGRDLGECPPPALRGTDKHNTAIQRDYVFDALACCPARLGRKFLAHRYSAAFPTDSYPWRVLGTSLVEDMILHTLRGERELNICTRECRGPAANTTRHFGVCDRMLVDW